MTHSAGLAPARFPTLGELAERVLPGAPAPCPAVGVEAGVLEVDFRCSSSRSRSRSRRRQSPPPRRDPLSRALASEQQWDQLRVRDDALAPGRGLGARQPLAMGPVPSVASRPSKLPGGAGHCAAHRRAPPRQRRVLVVGPPAAHAKAAALARRQAVAGSLTRTTALSAASTPVKRAVEVVLGSGLCRASSQSRRLLGTILRGRVRESAGQALCESGILLVLRGELASPRCGRVVARLTISAFEAWSHR